MDEIKTITVGDKTYSIKDEDAIHNVELTTKDSTAKLSFKNQLSENNATVLSIALSNGNLVFQLDNGNQINLALPSASTTQAGIVQLSDSLASTDKTIAATSNAIKNTNDRIDNANTDISNVNTRVDDANERINNSLTKKASVDTITPKTGYSKSCVKDNYYWYNNKLYKCTTACTITTSFTSANFVEVSPLPVATQSASVANSVAWSNVTGKLNVNENNNNAAGLMSVTDKQKLDGINFGAKVTKLTTTPTATDTDNRYYPIQTDNNNKLVVNVPWKEYTQGDNITLSGTTFSLTKTNVESALGITFTIE